MKAEIFRRWRHREVEGLLLTLTRYTRFVFFSKLILVILAAILALSVVLIPLLNKDKKGTRIEFTNTTKAPATEPIMLNPYYQGVDTNNQPYIIKAQTATQESEQVVFLTKVNADLTTNEGNWLALNAGQGTYLLDKRKLVLQHNVQFFHDEGHQFSTDYVEIELNKGIASSTLPVTGHGNLGTIKASGFIYFNNDKAIQFLGPVHMRLNNQ